MKNLAFFCAFFWLSNAKQATLFSTVGFKGEFKTFDGLDGECFNVEDYMHKEVRSINTRGNCILIYKNYGCFDEVKHTSRSHRLEMLSAVNRLESDCKDREDIKCCKTHHNLNDGGCEWNGAVASFRFC